MKIGNNDEWLRYMYVRELFFNQRLVFFISRKNILKKLNAKLRKTQNEIKIHV